jgi:hypothetical protein
MSGVLFQILRTLGLSGIGGIGWPVLALVAVSLVAAGSVAGWKASGAIHELRESRAAQDAAMTLAGIERQLRAVTRERLARSSQRNEVIKHVYVEVPKLVAPDQCRLTDDGLQQLRATGRAAFAGTQRVRDDAVRATGGTGGAGGR